jgi:hypothetical protein
MWLICPFFAILFRYFRVELQRTNSAISMKLIVTDTNVFFDIIKIGALPEFFSLDYDICTICLR